MRDTTKKPERTAQMSITVANHEYLIWLEGWKEAALLNLKQIDEKECSLEIWNHICDAISCLEG